MYYENSRKVVLCILDGLGISKQNNKSNNAFHIAKTPNIDYLLANYPNTELLAHGVNVGLPPGMMGNSEVGHITIGAGRVVTQDIQRISNAITSGSINDNDGLASLIKHNKGNKSNCHIVCLLSDGGIHSHILHLIFLLQRISSEMINVYLHIITDGRDVPPKSITKYINELEKNGLLDIENITVATITGRFYAMDRDRREERTEAAFMAINGDAGNTFASISEIIERYYSEGMTDEFFPPAIYCDTSINDRYKGVASGDTILLCNFRADRMRQITDKLISLSRKIGDIMIATMTNYSDTFKNEVTVLFAKDSSIKNTLNDVLKRNAKKQLRIAETEKYAHVSYFLNCGFETKDELEERILIDSPKVLNYVKTPEMSSSQLTENLVKAIESNKYDFICANFANLDMIGHTGNLYAAVEACEFVDECVHKLVLVSQKMGVTLFITSDHGNIEEMFNVQTGQPHTAHTLNPVPFIAVTHKGLKLRAGRGLADIAPTILKTMEIDKPREMTGIALF